MFWPDNKLAIFQYVFVSFIYFHDFYYSLEVKLKQRYYKMNRLT